MVASKNCEFVFSAAFETSRIHWTLSCIFKLYRGFLFICLSNLNTALTYEASVMQYYIHRRFHMPYVCVFNIVHRYEDTRSQRFLENV